jgi:alpha-tubulin suppressor-like RCC1 family protein
MFTTKKSALRTGWLVGVICFSSAVAYPQTTPVGGNVAAGTHFSIAVKANGSVWSWGKNANGQLGVGGVVDQGAPSAISNLSSVAAVACGDAHALALLADGTLRAWGKNASGQLGDASTTQRTAPIVVSGLNQVQAIAAGDNHTLAVKNDGTAWAWGLNTNGQLGDGTTAPQTSPVYIASLSGVITVAAGASHSLALKDDGTVWAWGLNTNGRLGDGTTVQRLTPVQVSTLGGVVAIDAGDTFSLALKSDGTVWAWGLNSSGQLGDGSVTQRTTPTAVSGLASIVAIRAGDAHGIALRSDGKVLVWGLNSSAQLGDGTVSNRTTPIVMADVDGAVAIAGGTNHTHVVLADGRVLSFGDNTNGQLGDGLLASRRDTLVQPMPWTNVTQFAPGASHSLVVRADGTLWSCGLNGNGQLGDASTTSRLTPVPVSALSSITRAAAGMAHSLALRGDGAVFAWGLNSSGQVGDGTTTQRTTPVALTSLSGVTALAAGDNHSIACNSGGNVFVWGLNTHGQLGDGLTANRNVPYQLPGLTEVVAVAAGTSHSLVLKSDGSVWAWGLNSNGQLGDAGTTQRITPVQVTGAGGTGYLTGVQAIAASGTHSLALKGDGTVWAWGNNTNGRLGDATTTRRTSPVQVKGVGGAGFLEAVHAIAAGKAFSVAVKADGSALAWGLNTNAELGLGDLVQRTSPAIVPGLAGGAGVGAGGNHAGVLLADGTLRLWGRNANGQLGIRLPVKSAAALRLVSNADDTDSDGLPDAWELTQWGSLAQAGEGDADKDGLTNINELVLGFDPNNPDIDKDHLTDPVDSHPTDYYNGVAPSLTKVAGDSQVALQEQYSETAFEVAVWDATATAPLVDAPVVFNITSGAGGLAASAAPPLYSSLNLRTDEDGTARAFFKHPAGAGTNQITVTAGLSEVIFGATTILPDTDSDGDGLSDLKEWSLGTDPNLVDSDGDGVGDGQEVVSGVSDPLVADIHNVPALIPGLRLHLKADEDVSLDGSGKVTSWMSQESSGIAATQTNATHRPLLVANAMNGNPVLRFNGSNNYMTLPYFMSDMTEGEMFVVMRSVHPNTNNCLFSYFTSGADTRIPYGATQVRDGFGAGTAFAFSRDGGDVTAPLIYNSSVAGGSWRSRLNGRLLYVAASSVNFANAQFQPLIGADRSGSYYGFANWFNGDLAEVLIYQRALSDTERDAVGAYLKNKYNVAINAPAAPIAFAANPLSSTSVSLAWTASVGHTFLLERRVIGGEWQALPLPAGATSYVDSTLTPGTAYEYRVRALSYGGISPSSPVLVAETFSGDVVDQMPVSGLRLWLKPEDLVLTGGGLAIWPDRGGVAEDAYQATAANRPQVISGAMGGLPAARFNGANAYLNLPHFMTGATAGEIFVAVKGSTAAGSCLFSWIGQTGGTLYPSGTDLVSDGFGSGAAYGFGAAGMALTVPRVYHASAQPGSWKASLDGVPLYSSPTNTVNFSPGSFTPLMGAARGGSYYALSNWLNGDVAEVLIFDRTLSAAERIAVGRYFNRKFSLGLTPPAVPADLTVAALSPTRVSLSWQTGSPASSVVIERSDDGAPWQVVAHLGGQTTYTDSGLVANSAYRYRVRAVNYGGSSVNSEEREVATLDVDEMSEVPQNGLRLWLRPEALTAEHAGLSAWRDNSGLGNDAVQATTAGRPQVVAGAMAGYPVVRFTGGGKSLNLPHFMSGAPEGELFVVVKASTTPNACLFSYVGSGGATFYPAAVGQISDGFGSSATRVIASPGVDLTMPHLYNARAAAGAWNARVNGVEVYQAPVNTPNFQNTSFTPLIGAARGGSYYALSHWFNGDVAEIIAYDRVLSALEREAVVFYLNRRYRLSPRAFDELHAAAYDSDGDELSNVVETSLGTNPYSRDSDGDGMSDGWEAAHGLNPLANDAGGDLDNDGAGNWAEYLAGTNPAIPAEEDPKAIVGLKVYRPAQGTR